MRARHGTPKLNKANPSITTRDTPNIKRDFVPTISLINTRGPFKTGLIFKREIQANM